MARTRNIKPGFFRNDKLCELQPLTRLLFAGLWTIADREGRLEDNPRRIRAEIFPYEDKVGVPKLDSMLQELCEPGFILRYESDGSRFINIPNFKKHQNPHVKEPASIIPAPDESSARPGQEQEKNQTSTGHVSALESDEPAAEPVKSVSARVLTTNHLVPSTNHQPRQPAAGSVSVSVPMSGRTEEWWLMWSATRGTNHEIAAKHAFGSVVTVLLERACFECTYSYLNSLDNPSRGYNPENFLYEQVRESFKARWPAARMPKESERAEGKAQMARDIEAMNQSGERR